MLEYIDYTIIGLVIIGFILGFRDGFIKKIISILGFFSAVLAALTFSPSLRSTMVKYLNINPSTAVTVSLIGIFLIVLIVSKLIANIIRPKKSVLGFIDRLIGAGLGGFQMALFISGLLIVLSLFNFPSYKDIPNLKFYQITYNLLPESFKFVQKIVPELKVVYDIFGKLKDKIIERNGRDIH